jgi:hypothetical protein
MERRGRARTGSWTEATRCWCDGSGRAAGGGWCQLGTTSGRAGMAECLIGAPVDRKSPGCTYESASTSPRGVLTFPDAARLVIRPARGNRETTLFSIPGSWMLPTRCPCLTQCMPGLGPIYPTRLCR